MTWDIRQGRGSTPCPLSAEKEKMGQLLEKIEWAVARDFYGDDRCCVRRALLEFEAMGNSRRRHHHHGIVLVLTALLLLVC